MGPVLKQSLGAFLKSIFMSHFKDKFHQPVLQVHHCCDALQELYSFHTRDKSWAWSMHLRVWEIGLLYCHDVILERLHATLYFNIFVLPNSSLKQQTVLWKAESWLLDCSCYFIIVVNLHSFYWFILKFSDATVLSQVPYFFMQMSTWLALWTKACRRGLPRPEPRMSPDLLMKKSLSWGGLTLGGALCLFHFFSRQHSSFSF